MTKQDKIKEALGLSEPWSLTSVIEKLAESSNILLHRYNYDGIHWEEISHCVDKSKEYVKRLEQVQEDLVNNGWIKIESEDDLPKLTIEYYVLKNGSLTTAYYRGNNRWVIPENDFPKTTEIHKITHYQPIEKPKPPLF